MCQRKVSLQECVVNWLTQLAEHYLPVVSNERYNDAIEALMKSSRRTGEKHSEILLLRHALHNSELRYQDLSTGFTELQKERQEVFQKWLEAEDDVSGLINELEALIREYDKLSDAYKKLVIHSYLQNKRNVLR